jgi:hypothetical protein
MNKEVTKGVVLLRDFSFHTHACSDDSTDIKGKSILLDLRFDKRRVVIVADVNTLLR